jgi:hypothetical protein
VAAKPLTTYIEVVQQACQSVGHPVPADVAGSVDEAVLRMGFYANQACAQMLYDYDWEVLTVPLSMNIVASVPNERETSFALPDDFASFIDDTHWNRNTQLPAIGPVGAVDWQWLVVRDAKITTRFMWRLRQGKLWIKSAPNTPQVLSFEYLQRTWARDGTDGSAKTFMSKNSDYHVFPANLVILLTRAKWLKNEGYDDRAAMADFQKAWDFEVGSNLGATALTLVPGYGYPYINAARNTPDTGYGDY